MREEKAMMMMMSVIVGNDAKSSCSMLSPSSSSSAQVHENWTIQCLQMKMMRRRERMVWSRFWSSWKPCEAVDLDESRRRREHPHSPPSKYRAHYRAQRVYWQTQNEESDHEESERTLMVMKSHADAVDAAAAAAAVAVEECENGERTQFDDRGSSTSLSAQTNRNCAHRNLRQK